MHKAAGASPRRIASTPSWIAVAPEEQAVESEIGEPRVAEALLKPLGDGAEEGNRSCQARVIAVTGGFQDIRIGHVAGLPGGLGEGDALRPIRSRRGGTAMKEASREIPRRSPPVRSPPAPRGWRIPAESSGAQNGSTSMKSTVPAMVVRRFSVEKRRMRWMPECPAVSALQLSAFALAERRDEAHPGDGDEGATEAITIGGHAQPLLTGTRRCIRPRQADHALATLVADAG